MRPLKLELVWKLEDDVELGMSLLVSVGEAT